MAARAWTLAETTSFFEDNDQMAIPTLTVTGGLAIEGIQEVSDLEEFNDDDLKSVLENLRRPGGTIIDPTNENRRLSRPSYVFGAKSFKRLKIAASAVRYYSTIGRAITPQNMHYGNVLKNFGEQWESIIKKAKDDEPEVPKITRALPVFKWTESFEDFLHQIIGTRHIALAYLIRDDVIPTDPTPPLVINRCYSETHGSVQGEMIARATHNHTKYNDDNMKLYKFLEEATRTTQYASSIRPFSKRKDGREAYLSIKRQYAGKDKWQSEIKKQENFIHNRVWKGNNNFSLESFIPQHRAAHVSLERCAQAVPHQIPDERTRVIHLIDAIQCGDSALQAAIAHIKSQSEDPDGMGNNFEEAAAYLLQFCPVSKKRKHVGNERNYNVSVVEQDNNGGRNNRNNKRKKPNKGETGVELRYYKPQEYRKLSAAQIEELRQWRKDNGLTREARKLKQQKNIKDQVVAAIKEASKDTGPEPKSIDNIEALKNFIVAVAKEEKVKSVDSNVKQDVKKVTFDESTLNAIVKRLK